MRRGTAAEWTSENPILDKGVHGYETDTRKSKRGDGSTPWNQLTYIPNEFALADLIQEVNILKGAEGGGGGLSLVFTEPEPTNLAVVRFLFENESDIFTQDLSDSGDNVTDTAGVFTVTESGLYRVDPRYSMDSGGSTTIQISFTFGGTIYPVQSTAADDGISASRTSGGGLEQLNPTVVALEAGDVLGCSLGGNLSGWNALIAEYKLWKILSF